MEMSGGPCPDDYQIPRVLPPLAQSGLLDSGVQ